MKQNMVTSLEYFVGGVPAGPIFKINLDSLKEMVSASEDKSFGNQAVEVCLIALVSYFEAFCKDEFASIINICPNLLRTFCSNRSDTAINIRELLAIDFDIPNKLGFVLSEKYDFGTAKSINSLYGDLLSITPISKDESKKFNRLLNDRNLLVHHGGIFTTKYNEQNFIQQQLGNRLFMDSLRVTKNDFYFWAEFVEGRVVKIIKTSHKAVVDFIKREKIKLPKEAKKAVDFLKWYG